MSTVGAIDAKSFLVIRLGAIGDVLRAIPAVRRLRKERPDAPIGWVVEDWAAGVIEGNANVDLLHVLNRGELEAGGRRAAAEFRRLIREIRCFKYEATLDFHGRFKSGLISRCSGARWRVGYRRGQSSEFNHLFNNVRLTLEDPLENRVYRFLHLLSALGLDTSYDPNDLGVVLPEAVKAVTAAWYDGAGAPAVAAFPGSSLKRAYHRWPAEKWTELLRSLGQQGAGSVVFWGPAERELCESIVRTAGETCLLAPPTSAVEMMAMIACFRAYVGCNTAAAHMAWMQGVPAAVFTGPVEQRTDSPLPPARFRLLRAEEHYDPAKSKKGQACVTTDVSVEEASAAVIALLDSARGKMP